MENDHPAVRLRPRGGTNAGIAAHGGKCRHHVIGRPIGKARMHAGRRKQIGTGLRHHDSHCAARRQARHKHLCPIERKFRDDLARQSRDDCRLAAVAPLMGGRKPVPARRGIVGGALLGIGYQQAVRFGKRVHVGADGEIIGILLAAMQHDDEAAFLRSRRNIELVAARAMRAGERTCQELRSLRERRRGWCLRTPLHVRGPSAANTLAQDLQDIAERLSHALHGRRARAGRIGACGRRCAPGAGRCRAKPAKAQGRQRWQCGESSGACLVRVIVSATRGIVPQGLLDDAGRLAGIG